MLTRLSCSCSCSDRWTQSRWIYCSHSRCCCSGCFTHRTNHTRYTAVPVSRPIYCETHTYTYTHIHTYTRTHIHTYTHTHIHTYTHTHIHTYTYTHIHTYTHTHIPTYTHTNIHTYTHTLRTRVHTRTRALDTLKNIIIRIFAALLKNDYIFELYQINIFGNVRYLL